MSEPMVERRSGRAPDGIERRRRKRDPLRILLSGLAYVVYPLLLANIFIFMAVAGEDRKAEVASEMSQTAEQTDGTVAQIKQTVPDAAPATAQSVSSWVHLHAFLPIMVAGLGIGGAGIVLDRMRARRRTDSSLVTPLVLTMMSVVGLFIYFIVRGMLA